MEFQTDDAEALKKLRGAEPFLVTKSPNAVREIHGDRKQICMSRILSINIGVRDSLLSKGDWYPLGST